MSNPYANKIRGNKKTRELHPKRSVPVRDLRRVAELARKLEATKEIKPTSLEGNVKLGSPERES